jgi:hypothetical protein
VLDNLISLLSLFAVLWYSVWVAIARAEALSLMDKNCPQEYASTKYAAYVAASTTPFYIAAGWFQANALAAPGNTGWLLGVLGPVSHFAFAVATHDRMIGKFIGSSVAVATFYVCVLSRHSQSRVPISFALMAFALVAQMGLGTVSNLLPVLKVTLPANMAGLVAPATTLLYENVAYLFLATAWTRWGAQREASIFVILAAMVVQSGETIRLTGVLSAVTAENPLYEGIISIMAGVVFESFARTKLRQVIQMAVMNQIAYAPSSEYGLLLQLKWRFGYTPMIVATPFLALYAVAGDEAARQLRTWALLVMHAGGKVTTDVIGILWQNYLHQSAPGAPAESLRETLKRVQGVHFPLLSNIFLLPSFNCLPSFLPFTVFLPSFLQLPSFLPSFNYRPLFLQLPTFLPSTSFLPSFTKNKNPPGTSWYTFRSSGNWDRPSHSPRLVHTAAWKVWESGCPTKWQGCSCL